MRAGVDLSKNFADQGLSVSGQAIKLFQIEITPYTPMIFKLSTISVPDSYISASKN